MVPESTRRAGPFEGNGVTTSFPFTFKTNVKEDLLVVKLALGVETDLVLDSDYSVTLNANQETSPGGSITYPISGSPLAAGQYLTIISDIAIQQNADLPNLGAFYPTVIEDALDRTIMLIGQLQEVLNRAIVLQPSTSGVTVELPTPSANLGIGWNSTGTALANIASVGAMTFTAIGTALANAASASAARTILGSTSVGDAVFIAANAAAARTALALGTSATLDFGTTSGNVPQLNAAGKLAAAVQSTLFQPLTAAVASNNLTFTLASGAKLEFSDGTSYVLTSSITLTVPNGGNLGTTSGALSRLWVVALKNSGTPELAVINTWNGTDIYEILPTDSVTTVAIGTGSDSAHTWYSTTLRSAQPIAPVGYVEVTQTGDAWNAAPALTQGWAPNVPLPGQIIQTRRKTHAGGATSYGSTAGVIDNTIPQNTEGNELTDLSVAITPRSALNLLRSEAILALAVGTVAQTMVGIFRDSTADAVCAFDILPGTGGTPMLLVTRAEFVSGTASATTTKIRVGVNGGAAVRLGADAAAAAVFGGVSKSMHRVEEVMR